MTAAISIRVYTGTNATTESAAQTGIDLISADNATNSTANRVTYPVAVSGTSYEKWVKLYVDTAADNQLDTLAVWGDGAVQATTTLSVGTTATGATPTSADSAVASNDWTSYTSGAKLGWHATAMTATGSKSVYLVFQLDAGAATPGDLTSCPLMGKPVRQSLSKSGKPKASGYGNPEPSLLQLTAIGSA